MADEPFLRHDGHVDVNAVTRAAIDLDDARPSGRLAADDPGGDEVELRRRLLVAEQCAQALVLRIVLTRVEVLDAQLLDFIAQHLVLLVHRGELPDVARHVVELAADP